MKSLGNDELTGNFDAECGATREVLSRVGDKWSVLTVVSLGAGAKRFNELKRLLDGISQRVLTTTLRGLERDGFVGRTVYPTNPPQVEYTLTELGLSLLGPVRVLATWAQEHKAAVYRARESFDEAKFMRSAADGEATPRPDDGAPNPGLPPSRA